MDEMKELSNRKVNTKEARQFISSVFSTPTSPDANQRAMKRVEELYHGHGHGALLESSKDTAYGLLNAVTEYVDHERRARSNDFRLDSAWFGQGANLKQHALSQALELVS